MKWKICQRKNTFPTETLNYLQIDLIYPHQQNDALTI